MFSVEFDQEGGQHVLVAPDGEKLTVRQDVWDRLKDTEIIFSEWKQLLQKWSIHLEKAPLLRRECSSDAEYRELRTAIRIHAGPEAGAGAEKPQDQK